MVRILQLILSASIIFSTSLSSMAQLTASERSVAKQSQVISSIADTPKKIRSLSVGDQVPDIKFNIVNNSGSGAKLSDFKGKLVLLDFWATWCYSCIGTFPKLDKLQNEFKGRLEIILVNSVEVSGDDKIKIQKFIQKRETADGKKFSLRLAVEDSLAFKLFPHYELPHYVWISSSGTVKAITASDEITSSNIQKALDDEYVSLSVKKDFFPDQLMDLNVDGPVTIDENLAYYSVFKKGKLEGLRAIEQERIQRDPDNQRNITRGIAMRNLPILEMYEKAVAYKKQFGAYTRKRLILEVENLSKLIFNGAKEEKDNWEKQNLFTYDLIVPASQIKDIYEYMIRDLNNYSGYLGRVEKRKVKCLVLLETKDAKQTMNITANPESSIVNKNHFLKNAPGFLLASILDHHPNIKYPVINEVKNVVVDLVLDLDKLDLDVVRKQLAPYGLELVEKEQELNVLVISDKK